MGQTRRKRNSNGSAVLPRSASAVIAELRVARTRSGRDLQEVALAASVHPSHLSKIENGWLDPTLGTLQRVCDVLGYELVLLPKESGEELEPSRTAES